MHQIVPPDIGSYSYAGTGYVISDSSKFYSLTTFTNGTTTATSNGALQAKTQLRPTIAMQRGGYCATGA